MMLNQGRDKGVYIGQPVVDSNGLIGNIISVNKFNSSLLLVTDPANAVPVENLRNGLRGIAIGIGESDILTLQHMPITADIKVGDKFVTSGLGGRYPKGYPIGIVSYVHDTKNRKFLDISIKPSANLESSNIVLILPKKAD